MAENYYFLKKYEKCDKIVCKFPSDHPFKIFLLLTKLYDQKNYNKVLEEGKAYLENIANKRPEHDMVVKNMLKIMEKAAEQKGDQEEKEGLENLIEILVENHNINKEESGTFMKPYYLSIPYDAFFHAIEFRSLF